MEPHRTPAAHDLGAPRTRVAHSAGNPRAPVTHSAGNPRTPATHDPGNHRTPVTRHPERRHPGVAVRRVVLHVPAPLAFELLTDVRRHAAWVPLTRIDVHGPTADDGRLLPGGTFTAVTGPAARRGLPGLPDRMRLETADPPVGRRQGTARFVKLGPVLTGWAELTVRPLGDALCEVTWTERIGVRGVPTALSDTMGRPLTAAMLRAVLRRAAREAEVR